MATQTVSWDQKLIFTPTITEDTDTLVFVNPEDATAHGDCAYDIIAHLKIDDYALNGRAKCALICGIAQWKHGEFGAVREEGTRKLKWGKGRPLTITKALMQWGRKKIVFADHGH